MTFKEFIEEYIYFLGRDWLSYPDSAMLESYLLDFLQAVGALHGGDMAVQDLLSVLTSTVD